MKNLLLLIVLMFAVNMVRSQDIIKTMYGDELNVQVNKITKEEVKYTKSEDPNTNYSMRIVKIDRITFEDGTVKIFGGTLDFNEEKDNEVLFERKEKKKETLQEKDSELENLSLTRNAEIPSNVYRLAKRGAKVFLQSRDNNAAIHAKKLINNWGFWQVTPDLSTADFILKLDVRFQGPMDFWVAANFLDVQSNTTLYSSDEYRAEKGNRDPNKKRAAVKHTVDKVLISNFK